MLRSSDIMVIVTLGWLGCCAPPASAGTIWQWTHQAEGEGWAHVFDGGPVETDSGYTPFQTTRGMSFSAFDDTRAGVLGAGFGSSGRSQITDQGETLLLVVDFNASYYADSRVGADRPGGEGGGRSVR